jgi:deoxyribonuclease-2
VGAIMLAVVFGRSFKGHLNPNHNEQEKQEKSRRGSVSPSKSRRGSVSPSKSRKGSVSPSKSRKGSVSPSVSDKSDNQLKSHSTGGHCKGILAWNATHVSWLVHSVPNFPREFTGSTISPIELSEHIYGQSFIHVTRQADEAFVKQAIAHIYLMNAHVFMKHNVPDVLQPKDMISTLSFSEEITHIAKSSKNEIDIYSEYLTIYAPDWQVETWKRGHAINTPSTIKDITHLSIFGLKYKDSQDHSKWATSEQYYWIGDLNRMTSQYKRGGGGFLVKNQGISNALKSIIVATESNLIAPVNSHQEKS